MELSGLLKKGTEKIPLEIPFLLLFSKFPLNFRSFKAHLLKFTQHQGLGEDNHNPTGFPSAARTVGSWLPLGQVMILLVIM